jgi:sec-independent protein translocase protein TatA
MEAPWHWVILALIVVALFGYKRLPEMTRSVARSMRIFKTEIKGLGDDPVAPAEPTPRAVIVPTTTVADARSADGVVDGTNPTSG